MTRNWRDKGGGTAKKLVSVNTDELRRQVGWRNSLDVDTNESDSGGDLKTKSQAKEQRGSSSV